MKRSTALASAILMAGALAGCGGDGGEEASADSYCDMLRDADKEFSAISGDKPDPKQLDAALQRVSEIADEAPGEVQPEWETMDAAITEVRTGLEEAGVTFEDLAKLSEDPSSLPEGVDQAKLMELATKVQKMGSQEFQQAATKIQEHAKTECDVDLGS